MAFEMSQAITTYLQVPILPHSPSSKNLM